MIRVLHIVGNLNRGGAETWLMHVLRGMDRRQLHFDFVVHADGPWDYRAEAETLGSKVLVCQSPRNPISYALNLANLVRTHGPYDCIHSHIHYFSGIPLLTARLLQVPARIVHGHLDSSWLDSDASFIRRSYITLMKQLIWGCSTKGIAVSTVAGDTLFPSGWRSDPKWSLIFCGIDLQPFREPVAREDIRRELNISPDAVVVGHVGRFQSQKNHSFLLDIAAAAIRVMPNVVFLLIGDGPLRSTIETKARELNLSEHVRFLGVRKDISRLMREVMNIFLLPSRYEGLPLVLLEAQASGLPCVISDRVSEEADVIRSLIARESLSSSPENWAKRLVAMSKNAESSSEPLPEDWSIETSIANLTQAYRTCLQQVETHDFGYPE